jgi:hypothetical protein
MLLADWFGRLAIDAGLDLSQHGSSGDSFTLGSPASYNVRAEFIKEEPYLRFIPSDSTHDELIAKLSAGAVGRVAAMDFGGEVWYSTELHELQWTMSSPQFMGTLLQRLGNQTRIVGWRRLGGDVLLEFTEEATKADGEASLLAPKAVVKVHIAVPGPRPGHFASHIAHSVVEVVGSICTFALGRPVTLPHVIFPAKKEKWEPAAARRADTTILTLARKGVPLDIMGWAWRRGGFSVFERLRSALLTFDAGVRQEHDAVASILYVVAAECLTTPAPSWRTNKLTTRFRKFYDELMPDALDQIVRHRNFEEAIGVRRGNRAPRALRKKTLERIYSFRSGQLHEGLDPSYRGFLADPVANIRRGLFSDFAEAAILGFIGAPRSSIIGHPMFAEGRPNVLDPAGVL